MMWTVIHIIDIVLWLFIAPSVIYVLFFALASLISRKSKNAVTSERLHHFLVLFPAYHEDAVILTTIKKFLQQTYPSTHFDVAVISDHMSDTTNATLQSLPITVYLPIFEQSSKAKALQYAMLHTSKEYDYVVVLDADNIVRSDFLEQLNASCNQGYQAIQCHRCAKNSDTDVAVLEGTSEEINNTIFRKAHNAIGLSSALIGSGMCFSFDWFKSNVYHLHTAVEDRELEALLMRQNIFIKYEASIPVYDEKVCTQDHFRRQRLRWMTGQLQSLLLMLPYLSTAVGKGNINYIDKTIQQALIPRSMLIVSTLLLAIITTCLYTHWGIKWWILFGALSFSLILAIPSHLRTKALFGKVFSLFKLTGSMFHNLTKMNVKNNDFIHTSHNK